jgi:hypothetical protein
MNRALALSSGVAIMFRARNGAVVARQPVAFVTERWRRCGRRPRSSNPITDAAADARLLLPDSNHAPRPLRSSDHCPSSEACMPRTGASLVPVGDKEHGDPPTRAAASMSRGATRQLAQRQPRAFEQARHAPRRPLLLLLGGAATRRTRHRCRGASTRGPSRRRTQRDDWLSSRPAQSVKTGASLGTSSMRPGATVLVCRRTGTARLMTVRRLAMRLAPAKGAVSRLTLWRQDPGRIVHGQGAAQSPAEQSVDCLR